MGLFAQHVRKRNLVRAENCVKCFQQKFLGPASVAHPGGVSGVEPPPLLELKKPHNFVDINSL